MKIQPRFTNANNEIMLTGRSATQHPAVSGDIKMSVPKRAYVTWMVASVLAIGLTVAAPSARADVLHFSYLFESTGQTLSGTLDGTLLGDDNTFTITDIATLFTDGDPVSIPAVSSPDLVFGGVADPAAVSLDGGFMNIFATDGTDAFFFSVADAIDFNASGIGADATRLYGGQTNPEAYVQANWSASLVSTPEPSTMALMLSPLGLLAARFKPRWSIRRPRK